MLREFFLPPRARAACGDESVAGFVRRHFGQAALEKIADPLLAGVFGGDSEQLSVRSVLPRFVEMEEQHGSLTRAAIGLRRQRRQASSAIGEAGSRTPAPLFLTLKDGMGSLVDTLSARLDVARLHLGRRAVAIGRAGAHKLGAAYAIRTEDGAVQPADAVILALPAYECARLLAPLDSPLAEALGGIPYSSSLTVSLGYDPPAGCKLPPGFGFLAPRSAGCRLLAATFVHQKFAHRVPPGGALLRGFLGGVRDAAVLDLAEEEIARLVRGELESVLKLCAEPDIVRITRWPASMPQYVAGHGERLERIRSSLAGTGGLGGLFLAGNAYSGVGISDCIRTARAAAEGAREFVAATRG